MPLITKNSIVFAGGLPASGRARVPAEANSLEKVG